MERHQFFGLIGAIWIGLGIADDNWTLKLAGVGFMAVGAWMSRRDKPGDA